MTTLRYFREHLDAALAGVGVKSVSQWVAERPGKHLWVDLPWNGKTFRACAACSVRQQLEAGVVKLSGPMRCAGIAPVTPRVDAMLEKLAKSPR